MDEGGLTLPAPPQANAALGVTLAWLRDAPWPKGSGSPGTRLFGAPNAADTLAGRLTTAGLSAWAEIVQERAEELPVAPIELRWLASHAALRLAVAADHADLFQVVDDLQAVGNESDLTLATAVMTELQGLSDAHPLLAAVDRRVHAIYGSRFFERLRRYVEAAPQETLRTRDLWPGPGDLPMGDGWAHHVAATLWPTKYFALLAPFPPPFQHAVIELVRGLGMDVLRSAIKGSPDLFSIDGRPLGPVALLGLLDTADEPHAEVDSPAQTWRAVFDDLFARQDGAWIGRAWLQQIVWRGEPRRAGRTPEAVAHDLAQREALIAELSSRIPPLGADVFDWIQAEEPLWQVHRVLVEAAVLAAHDQVSAASEVLARAVRDGLVTATGRPAGLATASPEALIVGRVLSRLPDASGWFASLWRDTHDLREHLSFSAHRNFDNPAYPALAWGLHGVNVAKGAGGDAGAFWRTLAEAVFETQLIDPNARLFNGAMPPIVRVTVQLGAAFAEGGEIATTDLAAFMADQLEPDAEHARLWRDALSAASQATMLTVGRTVGADNLCRALELGLGESSTRAGEAVLREDREALLAFAALL